MAAVRLVFATLARRAIQCARNLITALEMGAFAALSALSAAALRRTAPILPCSGNIKTCWTGPSARTVVRGNIAMMFAARRVNYACRVSSQSQLAATSARSAQPANSRVIEVKRSATTALWGDTLERWALRALLGADSVHWRTTLPPTARCATSAHQAWCRRWAADCASLVSLAATAQEIPATAGLARSASMVHERIAAG